MNTSAQCGVPPAPPEGERPPTETEDTMAQEGTQDNYQILFANLKQQMDNMIASCQEATNQMVTTTGQMMASLVTQTQFQNNLVNQHFQNSISSADQVNKLLLQHIARVWSDDARLARELDIPEAVANVLVATAGKIPTPDLLIAIAELLKTTEQKQ